MKKTLILMTAIVFTIVSKAQTNPAITAWLRNTTGIKSSHWVKGNSTVTQDSDSANVKTVYYSGNYAYIRTNGLPSYPTGPYLDKNPSIATTQNTIFKIPLNPKVQTGSHTSTTGGDIGVFINGVALFDYRDGYSWNNTNNTLAGGPMSTLRGDGVWNRDAIVGELIGFDCAKGHPAMGNYHHHQNPSSFKLDLKVINSVCNLYASDGLYTIDSTKHSPLLGFTYDGFPIYGAYAYKNVDGTGGIARMKSSYSLRNVTKRNTYSDGSSVTAGPDVSGTYFLGYFREDYQYNTTYTATPDYLDEHNGRFCVTPEYPTGTYCYYATVDANWNSAYPYVVGPTFYGVYANAQVTSISETVAEYKGNPLAVNLVSFEGNIVSNATILKWATSSETLNKSFSIERSNDGKNYQSIGSVNGKGTTTTLNDYSYTDLSPVKGTNFYRLKQYDWKGNYKYSNIITVNYQKEAFNLKVFPNPSADYFVVQANDMVRNDIQIVVTNMKGTRLITKTIPQGSTLSIIETSTLYAGDYVVAAFDKTGYKKSFKVVVRK